VRRHIHVVLIIAVVITAAVIGGPRLGLPVVQAQSGVTYVSQSYASYQTHTLNHPTGVAVASGGGWPGLYISDTGSNKIQWFNWNTNTLSVFAGTGAAGYVNGTTLQSQFHAPTGIGPITIIRWVDPNQRVKWFMYFSVNDSLNYAERLIQLGYYPNQFTFTNSVTTAAGTGAQGYIDGPALSAKFSSLAGVHAPTASTSYIADAPNHAIRTLGSSTVATYAGNGTPGYVNGFRTAARFNYPTSAASDAAGNIFVADAGNHAIRKIDSSGNVTTFAGTGTPGFVNGTGTSAKFNNPVGVVFNPADNYFYVTDTGNNSIRRINSAGVVTTYAGAAQGGLVNGSLAAARFQAPTGLAIYGGFMYVADSMNNAIRRVDMTQSVVSTYIN
jgi:hypothetical protein